jgi:hypothetical protein
MTQPANGKPKNAIVMRFATLGGATVIVTLARQSDHSWQCLGCLDCNRGPMYEAGARREANEHAGRCRSMPAPEDKLLGRR